jgi:titin
VNVVGDSADSNQLTGIIAATQPDAPQNLIRATSVIITDDKITLDWDVPASDGGSAITGYKVYWN